MRILSCGKQKSSKKNLVVDPSMGPEHTGGKKIGPSDMEVDVVVHSPNVKTTLAGGYETPKTADSVETTRNLYPGSTTTMDTESNTSHKNSGGDLKLERNSQGMLHLGPYIFHKKLGKGAQGVVYLANDKDKGTSHAVKLVRLPAVTSNRSKEKRDKALIHLKAEVSALKMSPHPNILALIHFVPQCVYPMPLKVTSPVKGSKTSIDISPDRGSSVSTVVYDHSENANGELGDSTRTTHSEVDELFKAGDHVSAFVLDLASNGELMVVLVNTGALPEDISRAYFVQIASALAQCHEFGVYHRDIKPENILLDSNFQIKLADFGMAKLMNGGDMGKKFCSTVCGTRGYMAPEVIGGKGYDPSKSDAWSIGILLFIMLSGNPPMCYAHTSDWWYRAIYTENVERFWRAHERFKPGIFNELSRDLITKLLVPDPAKRITVSEALQHAYIKTSPLPSPQSVETIMRAIKRKADEAQDMELTQVLDRKRAEVSAKNQGRTFDPFEAKSKRSAGVGSKESPPHLSPQATTKDLLPPLAEFYMLDISFLSESSQACAALEEIHMACKCAGASNVSVCVSDFRVNVEYRSDRKIVGEEDVDGLDVEPTCVPVMDDAMLGDEVVTLEINMYQRNIGDANVLFLQIEKLSGATVTALAFVERLKRGLGEAVMSHVDNTKDGSTAKAVENLPMSLTPMLTV